MEAKSIVDTRESERDNMVIAEKTSGKKMFRGVLLNIDTGKYLRIYRLEGTEKFILE